MRYKYKSLKYGLIKYPACIAFTVTGKCVPFLCIIFNMLSISACFGKNLCANLPVLTRPCNSVGPWEYDLSGLWYISAITPSWYGGFSSKYVLNVLLQCINVLVLNFLRSYLCKYLNWFRRKPIKWISIARIFLLTSSISFLAIVLEIESCSDIVCGIV